MINSSPRKLALSHWLKSNYPNEYSQNFKHQKFLFFYEAFSKSQNKEAELSGLQGWDNGPVFSAVWGDRRHEESDFIESMKRANEDFHSLIDNEIAIKSAFLMRIMNKRSLIDLTHSFNIWNCKEGLINLYNKVSLSEHDLSEDDVIKLDMLFNLYSVETIKNTAIYSYLGYSFLFSKSDFEDLTQEHFAALNELVENGSVEQISYVELENGVLLID